MSARDQLVKSQVETAVSMLQALYAKHRQGGMALNQAKKLGADLLRALRYGTDGYFWADTTEGINVVFFGRKDVEGTSRLEMKDSKGTFLMKKFIATCRRAGGGFVGYTFPKMGRSKPLPKRSYVFLFKPFGWILGTGYYR